MSKQRFHLFLLISTLTLLLTACASDGGDNSVTQPEPSNFVSYTDEELGLTLSYPEDWIVHNSIGGLTVATNQTVIDSDSLADIGDNGFVLIIPGEIDVLNFQTGQKIEEGDPLPALYIYQQLLEKDGQNYLGVEPPVELELEGQYGAVTLTRSMIDGQPFMTFLAVVMNDGQIALISAGALEDSFDALRPSLEQIMQSVQVTVPASLK